MTLSCSKGYLHIVAMLVDHGANVDERNEVILKRGREREMCRSALKLAANTQFPLRKKQFERAFFRKQMVVELVVALFFVAIKLEISTSTLADCSKILWRCIYF